LRSLYASLLFAAFAVIPATSAHADTYSVYLIGETNNINNVGIDAIGRVLIERSGGGPDLTQYTIFQNGSSVYSSTVAPDFVADNGGACAAPPTPAPVLQLHGVYACNGGRQVYSTIGLPPNFPKAIWEVSPTTGPYGDFAAAFWQLDLVRINAEGDFVFEDESFEKVYQVVRTATTPEPSSIALISSGLLGAAGFIRRRFTR
jgi:hypothetical protein